MSTKSSQFEEPEQLAPIYNGIGSSNEYEDTEVLVSKAESAPVAHGFFSNIDGGLRGWLTVLGAWMFQFSMVGAVTAFGSFQTFYEDQWLKTYSESSISWIGSVQLFLEFFLGVFGGLLLDAGRWRLTVRGGSVLFVFAFFMLSFCKPGQYAPVLLSQGIGMGAGLGFAYLPVSGIVSKHFSTRRSLAMGVITTGTSLGGFAFSVLASKLLTSSLGFAWTVRVSAFIALGCMLMANLLVSQPKRPLEEKGRPESSHSTEEEIKEKDKPRSIAQLLRDPAYLAVIASGFVVSLGLYYPMFVIQSFALDHGISPGLAAWLLSIINLSSVLGRLVPNWFADRFGTLEVYIPCTAAAGITVFAIGAATNHSAIVVVCILYGFFSGSIVSLYFPTVCALDPHIDSAGMRLGIACLPVAVASLVGTPIAGALVGQHSNWWYGLGFAGISEIASAALLAFAWAMQKKR